MVFEPSRIGARRLRVELQEPGETADDIGGVTRTFEPRVTLWARLQPGAGTERADAQRAESAATHQLTIRWRNDVTAAMRFVSGARVFNVLAVADPDGRRRDLVCRVEEVRT